MTNSFDVLSTGLADLEERHPGRAGGLTVGKVHDEPGLRVRTIALDAGALLDEHVAGVPVLIHVVSGRVQFDIGGASHDLAAGALVRADGAVPHAVRAQEPSRLVLTLIG